MDRRGTPNKSFDRRAGGPAVRRHGERTSNDDSTTRNLARPTSMAPLPGSEPNYARRRAAVGIGAASLIVIGAVLVVSLIGADEAGDETASEVVSLERPIATAAELAAPAEVVRPIHHGYDADALYVALYGSVGTGRLGVLGETDVAGSIERAGEVGEEYEGFGPTVVPTFEIIASVASFEAGPDGDYSNEASIASLQPWVDAADEAEYHVVLDLQSGRQRFPSQITEFEPLLLEPHVSVALDPEWRVGPNEIPKGGKIGTVSGEEVNQTVEYLDRLVEANDLPPKMLIVHQFDDRMITEKTTIRGTDNVKIVIHMDGFGSLELKRGTYSRVTSDLPPDAVVGWKNFYDEDKPTPTPQETMENDPVPMFVSFQ